MSPLIIVIIQDYLNNNLIQVKLDTKFLIVTISDISKVKEKNATSSPSSNGHVIITVFSRIDT